MMKKIISVLIILIFVSMLFLFPTRVQAQYEEIKVATGTIDPGDFKPGDLTDTDVKPVTDKANVIIGTIQVIGVAVTVIVLMIMGIKYMTGSISEKAEYKKTMIPYLVGVLIFFGLTQFLGIIIKVAQGIN